MDQERKLNIPFFEFRVLVEFDDKYKIFVAYCLNTGNVVSADDPETTIQMIKEVLEDEVYHAIKFENYSNLFSSTAPPEVWQKWHALASKQKPREIDLDIKIERVSLHDGEQTARFELATAVC
jgi:hypothetical protein